MWWVGRDRKRSRKSALIFFSLVSLVSACGGPPEQSVEGSETPASLALATGTQTDFTGISEGVPQTVSLEIQNLSSTVPATEIQFASNLFAPFSFTGGSYPGTNGTCSDTLEPRDLCRLEIQIASASVGTFSETLAFNYNDGLSVQNFEFSISAEVSPPPIIESLGGFQSGLTHVLAPGGSQRLLVFLHAMDIVNADSDLTNVTFGGQSLSPVAEIMTSSGYRTRVEVWVCNETCLGGAIGNDFNLTYDNAVDRFPNYYSILLSNVNQANPIVDVQTAANSNTNSLVFPSLFEVEGGLTILTGAHGNMSTMTLNSDGVSTSQSIVDQTDTDDSQMRQISGFYSETADSAGTNYRIDASGSQRIVGITLSLRPL